MTGRKSTTKKTKVTKKRAIAKKRYYDKTTYQLSNNISLGNKKVVKLCYNATFPFQNGLAVPDYHTFNMNSIYDPDQFVGGHQPFGHDQYALLYKRYEVLRSHLVATFMHDGASGAGVVCCGTTLDNNASVDNELNTRIEQVHGRGIKWLMANSRDKVTCTSYFDSKTFFDKESVTDDHQLGAPFGNNPTLPAYCVVWTQAPLGVAATKPTLVNVRIEYTVLLTIPQILTQS